ncbi:hypothetical protein C2E25_00095 [Geothermobacter hydrogeniphilus]|uniref:Transcriptional regulator AbiEi antitoxin N-terminal domain-containing protein n=1 Tax=Geothermobacter hydrogeniphilus TaxID=1969733 RepID=A0A2K2HEF2_9BACT|nr:type IV toxin-antitoxin system AbiEi family antitoxin domain-containing protein [Geothermobacter hydrogeniphilus]PNU21668.1 hypothetical protein C2E25_00095 [Geothermobacter hydrogeniphilus]
MSTDGLHSGEILKRALFDLPSGMPVTTRYLKEVGISRQLAHRYVQSGWLQQLGYGYFLRPGDHLTEKGVAAALQANGVKVHIGGKSALALKGFSHFLRLGGETLYLFGRGTRTLPKWLLAQFKVNLSNAALFNEWQDLEGRLGVSRLDHDPEAPFASEPERAALELLDLIPKRQTLEEAGFILEGLQALRSGKMTDLLKACRKVKVKRLFWHVAEELDLPVLRKVNPAEIDFGSKSAYILQGENNLVLRNPNG